MCISCVLYGCGFYTANWKLTQVFETKQQQRNHISHHIIALKNHVFMKQLPLEIRQGRYTRHNHTQIQSKVAPHRCARDKTHTQ